MIRAGVVSVALGLVGCAAESGAPGAACLGGAGIYDCDGSCVSTIYQGDGVCHDGPGSPSLACEALAWDGADCGSCGDGDLQAGEACDDGNTTSGDGCDSNCAIEEPPDTAWEGDTSGLGECGDGTVDRDEECDDGNLLNGDGCTKACTREIFDYNYLYFHFYFGIDDAGKVSDVSVFTTDFPARFVITMLKEDFTNPGEFLECDLEYRITVGLGETMPEGGPGAGASDLLQWMDRNGLQWGVALEPDATPGRLGTSGCYMDPADFADDIFTSAFGQEAVYIGLMQEPTETALTAWEEYYYDPLDDSTIAPEFVYGSKLRTPAGVLPSTSNRMMEDMAVNHSDMDATGSVTVVDNRYQLVPRTDVFPEGSNKPVRGWARGLAMTIYTANRP